MNEFAKKLDIDNIYSKTPKEVFAAICLALAHNQAESYDLEPAVKEILTTWNSLHEAGIVEQPPIKKFFLTKNVLI